MKIKVKQIYFDCGDFCLNGKTLKSNDFVVSMLPFHPNSDKFNWVPGLCGEYDGTYEICVQYASGSASYFAEGVFCLVHCDSDEEEN